MNKIDNNIFIAEGIKNGSLQRRGVDSFINNCLL
jgi:hypothetical protein